MKSYRSPIRDNNFLTFVGIFIVTLLIVFGYRYSDVEAAETTSYNYSNNYTGEEKARIAHEPYVYEKYTGVPESVRLEIESKLADSNREEDVVSNSIKASNKEEIECSTMNIAGKNISTANIGYVQEVDGEVSDYKEETDEEEDNTVDDMAYYGCLELTAYTWTGNPCADGVYPTSGHTVACNNSELWHKWIYIEGYGTYYVHDTGGMGYGVIDVYMDSYDSCIQFGRRSANIYILN